MLQWMKTARRDRKRSRRFVVGLALLPALLLGCAPAPMRPMPMHPVADGPPVDMTVCTPIVLPDSSRIEATAYDAGLPTSGQWRDGFDLADMDGDGHLDLLHGPARKGRMQPTIFRGDGHARFAPWETAHFPPLPYDYGDIHAADFNRDGRMDIALSSHLRGLAVLIDEARGSYAPWGEGLVLVAPGSGPTAFASRAIAVADWNGDGAPDLLALNEGPSRFAAMADTQALAVFLNRGGFWERLDTPNASPGFGDALATGDANGDGRIDALLGSMMVGARLQLRLGDGAGGQAVALRTLPPRAAITATAMRDLDGDGRDELLLGTRALPASGFCSALQLAALAAGDGDGEERGTVLWRETSTDPVVAIASDDIDGDGFVDLVAVRESGAMLLFSGGVDGFARDRSLPVPDAMRGCSVFDAHLRDLDGDQHPELIVSYAADTAGSGRPECTSGGGFQAWRLRAR